MDFLANRINQIKVSLCKCVGCLVTPVCLAGRLEKQRKSSYVSLIEEAEKWGREKGRKGKERKSTRIKEVEVQRKREAGCVTSEAGVMVKCLLSSALSLCCPHGVLASVCASKRSRRDT